MRPADAAPDPADSYTCAPGSATYYSLLYTGAAQRPAIEALLGLHELLLDVPRRCSDPGVAGAKLGWWAQELERLGRGQPGHPLTRHLAASLADFAIDPAALGAVAEAMLGRLGHRQAPPAAALEARHAALSGTVWRLWARIAGARSADALGAAEALGIASGRHRDLRALATDLTLGYVHLAREELAHVGLDRAPPAHPQHQAPVRRLLEERHADLDARVETARQRLPAHESALLLGPLTLAAIETAERAAARRAGPQADPARSTLTPLRMLWIAWRTARAVRRPRTH